MKLDGSYCMKAPRTRVWFVLNDTQSLKSALPGCEEMIEVETGIYEVVLKVGVAGIRGTYRGKVRIENCIPDRSYTMTVEGKGAPGFIRGVGDIVLADDPTGTSVTYTGTLHVGGTLAAVGQRLIQGASRMVVGQFFSRLESIAVSETP